MSTAKNLKNILGIVGILFTTTISWAQTLDWVQQIGGANMDEGKSIAVDQNGNIYTTGYFRGTSDFDPGTGVFNLSSIGNTIDIFITKSDASGNLIWAKMIGEYGSDLGNSIAVDVNGNVYTTGYFQGIVDFDPGAGIFNLTSIDGGDDVFISKLDSSGDFVWAKQIGGASPDHAYALTLDSDGDIYVTGDFKATADFDPSAATANLTAAGQTDIFVEKFDAAGNAIWAKQLGGTDYEKVYSIAVDASKNVYTTGYFQGIGADFDPGPEVFSYSTSGEPNAFVSKLDASGNFVWATKQMSNSRGFGLTVDDIGNVYTTGDLFTGSNNNSFVSKVDAAGTWLWYKQLGADQGNDIVLDAAGNIYTTGYFSDGADFNPGPGNYYLYSTGLNNIYISQLDNSGNFISAKQMGSPNNNDCGNAIVIDSSGDLYLTGGFDGEADFDPNSGTFYLTTAGSLDTFILKLNPCIQPPNATDMTAPVNLSICKNNSTTLSASGSGVLGWYSASSGGTYLGGGTNFTTPVLNTSTSYYVQDSTCAASVTRTAIVVTVNALPNVTFNASATAICTGNSVTLSGVGAVSYSWSGGLTDGVSFVPSTTTTYTVTGTDVNNCSNTADVTITVNALPNVSANATTITVCASNPVTFIGQGALFYSWTGGVTDGVPFIPLATATYTVSGTDANSCVNTADITVTVIALPTVTANATTTAVCAGTLVTLTGGGAFSYSWTGGVTNGAAFVPSTTTTYTVTGTDVNSCTNSASITVTVHPLPNVTANATATTVCAGTSVTLTGGGATTYSWTGGVTNGVAFVPSSTTSYTVTGTDINNCTNTASKTITINALPNVATSINGFTISATLNNAAYQWVDCDNNNAIIPNEISQSFTAAANGNYAVIVIKNGCSDISACVAINTIGINELGLINPLKIYPNPNNGMFTLSAPYEGEYKIINELGQSIQVLKLSAANKYTVTVENLSTGVYFIIGLNKKNELIQQKIVITK